MIKDYLQRAVRSIELEEPDRAKEILQDTIKLMESKEAKIKAEVVPKKGIYYLFFDDVLRATKVEGIDVVEIFVDGKKIYDKNLSD